MRVALFVSCLVDLYRPRVGFAAVRLLEQAGCQVEVPTQTCCGQPAYNNGDLENARAIARQVIEAFSGYSYVVVPSGSCAGMLTRHYPELFVDQPQWQERARDLAGRTRELLSFLHDTLGKSDFGATCTASATYHDSCSSLRELGVQNQPRELLGRVAGLRLVELADTQACCGFGGTFCVKYPELSARMVDDKARAVEATGADMLLAGDLGCLLNIAGRLRRTGSTVRVHHVAEVLAGMADEPGLGEGREP
ncbi:MAG: (Fe-S)-binding protein [Gammaproteobacteria bacterium]